MQGTLVCVLTDGDANGDALALGAEVSERLGLRLVLAQAVDGIDRAGVGGEHESVSTKASRRGAELRLAQLADEHGVRDRAERRPCSGGSRRRRPPT